MTAALLDGKQLAQTMQTEIAAEAAELLQTHGIRPGLVAVLVGENEASKLYVRNKRRACEKVGIASFLHELPASTSETVAGESISARYLVIGRKRFTVSML